MKPTLLSQTSSPLAHELAGWTLAELRIMTPNASRIRILLAIVNML